MATLSNEFEKESKQLKIIPKGAKVLSKNQTDFNKLINRIQNLERQLAVEEEKLNNLLSFYNANIPPEKKVNSEIKIEFAFMLNRTSKENKYSQKQITHIRELILKLLDDAFCNIVPNTEQEELFNSWSKTTYKEEMEIQMKMEKAMFSGFMNSMFGVDLDKENVDEMDPESFEAFKAKLEENIKAQMENEGENKQFKKSKKSKKAIAKENQLKAEEELKSKNLRSHLYFTY